MRLTEERIVPDNMDPMNGMLLEHIARYHFAIYYCRGTVLDIASGAGYGTQLIAKTCKDKVTQVIGADLSQEAITYARGRYHHPLAYFRQGDALDDSFMDSLGQFDTILSFETIEHVPDDRLFLEQLMKRLKPGGTLILSTPFGRGRGQPSNDPFHVHQLTPGEFRNLFSPYPGTEFYYQRGVLIEPPRENMYHPIGIALYTKTSGR
ncbi:class I SAM-dependent methyltransferase [Planococcus lenghuensis]|uniref:SAM-dependent methyltransferase n=1 Tax=Planococcus lenghuensis TaxID=2213202 RepID=A0A1Q2L2C2_9BACL|nr:class I SAM-dependent methyltransferase [Planococcus lenghuensis]AQQ54534.1 SAM-dependent methyltransferase [Planococcus lenghuensis]